MNEQMHRLTTEQLQHLRQIEPVGVSTAARDGSGNLFLAALKTLDRAALAEFVDECRFESGDIIFNEGDVGDAMYMIWSGRVAVVKGSVSDPVEVMYRGPGDTVGEMALLNKKMRSATLVALDDTRLLRVASESMQKMILQQPAIGISMLSQMSERLRQARNSSTMNRKQNQLMTGRMAELREENEHLKLLDRVRQDTIDLVIHDLRNPLANMNIVLQMLDVMLPTDVLQANRDLLDIARVANGRMQRLVDSLLDMRRIENGVLEPDISFIDLRQLVDDALQQNQFGLERRQIHVAVSMSERLPAIPMDETLIIRVLNNLIDNAIKYISEGGHLDIQAVVDDNLVQVSVCDDGPGIDPEHRERIFEQFTQADKDGEQKYGFGLGLAFCRQAVEAHNGRIWVEPNENDVGSRFAFTLPLHLPPTAVRGEG